MHLQRYPLRGLGILASAALVLFIFGCKGEISFSTASLSDPVLCLDVEPDTLKPGEKTDVFSPDTPEIFCSVRLKNAPDDTLISSEWIYLKGEVEGLENHKIDSYELTTGGSKHLSFSLSKPDAGFPKGDYECRLFLNQKEKFKVPFKVE